MTFAHQTFHNQYVLDKDPKLKLGYTLQLVDKRYVTLLCTENVYKQVYEGYIHSTAAASSSGPLCPETWAGVSM